MKIAVLGSHPATVYNAPWGDPDWQIWACSPHNFERRDLPRVDAWFEVHNPAPHPTRSDMYLEFVRSLTPVLPVYMRDRSKHPLAIQYPEQEMKAEFPEPWFTSSIAYILAYAIMKKPEAIGIWGILQESESEYAYQRCGTQSFLWEAHKRGIDVLVPSICTLFEPPPENW